MQTFLPLPNFWRSLLTLDTKRLGKQRVETMQILNALRSGGGWSNHPATRMWRGYESALEVYLIQCIDLWELRGFRNTMIRPPKPRVYRLPPWFGDENFHRSHQSNLVRKLPSHYRRYFVDVPDNLPYVWPV